MKISRFRTLRGYDMLADTDISPTMEDYLEMIYRQAAQGECTRVNRLAQMLNVKPSSASKMASKLRDAGLVDFEPYGVISLTEAGSRTGAYLIHRHNVLNSFFSLLNGTEDELELVERIEHYIDEGTLRNLEVLLEGMGKQRNDNEESKTSE